MSMLSTKESGEILNKIFYNCAPSSLANNIVILKTGSQPWSEELSGKYHYQLCESHIQMYHPSLQNLWYGQMKYLNLSNWNCTVSWSDKRRGAETPFPGRELWWENPKEAAPKALWWGCTYLMPAQWQGAGSSRRAHPRASSAAYLCSWDQHGMVTFKTGC